MNLPVLPENPPHDRSEQAWYADGLQFSCTQCGNCCTGGPGYVWISDEEITRLAAYLNKPEIDVIADFCRRVDGRLSLRERRNRGLYDCIFLQEVPDVREIEGQTVRSTRRICAIYPVRPLQCRTWPFWPENLSSPRAWEIAGQKCPGMNLGKPWPLSRIEEIRDAKDWPPQPPSSK